MQPEELIESSIVNEIKEVLVERGESIAVGESVTSGLLQAALSQAVEAMKFYQGGITAYNLGQKYRHLNIDPIHATSCNCVSGKVARGMALNCCQLFNSDWGIGITGYASAVPEADNKVFAHYAIAHKGEVVIDEKITPPEDVPLNVQIYYVKEILGKLRDHLRASE